MASGKKLYVLAAEANIAKSMPSQIKARTSGASFYSASKLAKPLGFRDLPDLVNAAWTWWHSPDRSQIPTSSSEAARAEGIRLAHSYALSQAQIDRVLERFPLPDYEHQDVLWWLARFHEERSLDAERAGARRAAKHVEAQANRGRKAIREQKDRMKARAQGAPRRHSKAS